MSRFFSTTDQAKWCKMDHQMRSPSYKDWKQVKVLEIGCGSGRWARSLLAAEGEEMISNVTWQYFCDPNVWVSLLKTASSSNVKGISEFLLLPWLIESLFKSWNKPKTKKTPCNHLRDARTPPPPTKGLAIFGNRLLQHHGGRICTWDQRVSWNCFCWCDFEKRYGKNW